MRAKTLAATETLWENFLLVQNTYSPITFVESILTLNELKELFRTTASNNMKQAIIHYKDEKQFSEQMQKCFLPNRNNSRLYVSDRLWLIYYCATAFYARLALLTQISLKKNEYQNWREDKPTIQLLSNILPKNIVDDLVNCKPDEYNPTMHQAMTYIDAALLKESRRVISGSQALAESLTDINAVMQLELANIDAQKSK